MRPAALRPCGRLAVRTHLPCQQEEVTGTYDDFDAAVVWAGLAFEISAGETDKRCKLR